MKRLPLVVLLGSLCALSTAQATTYVRVEKDGTKTYSDRPIPGGQPVDLQPAQTYSPAPAVDYSSSSTVAKDAQAEFRYESCAISPSQDSTFANPESLTISATTNPSLRSDDHLVMTVDGQRVSGVNAGTFTMAPVNRGTHTVSVTVTSPDGRTLCTSTSAFHVQQPGLNSPANQRNAPPRPRPRG